MAKKPYHLAAPRYDNVFDQILKKGIAEGWIPERTKASRLWYQQQAQRVRIVNPKELMASDPSRFRQSVQIGRMYMFYYYPKLREKLPYYDQFPIVIPISIYSNGFLGLNLHYLPPTLRARLMDGLLNLANNSRYDETTKLQITYRMLKSITKLRGYKPCIKRYLKGFIGSRFVNVAANEWTIAMFLPLERFQKATVRTVWQDSTNKIKGWS